MLKKIILGTLLLGLVGVLVVGGVIRTQAKTGATAETGGHGRGTELAAYPADAERSGGNNGNSGQGQAQGNRTDNDGQRLYSNRTDEPVTLIQVEGAVVQQPGSGIDLVIATADGELVIGTGPEYMAQQDFGLQQGEQIQVQGYWQDDEFKAVRVVRMADGAFIDLRDQAGRPAWSGGGRNAQASGTANDTRGEAGIGQANVDGWIQISGRVISADADALVVENESGQQVLVENRAWWFAQDAQFKAQVGDLLNLTGFYENQDFEVGQIENLTSGEMVLLRDTSGRPLWAGGGRRDI